VHEVLAKASFDSELRLLDGELCSRRGWILQVAEYPQLTVDFTRASRPSLRLVVECANFPSVPPAVALANDNGEMLLQVPALPGGQFHQGPHAKTGRPFVCMRGTREYHTHESHLTDSWDNYRATPEFSLGGILTQIWNAWMKVPV
jgi:Predicted metal binding domain